MPSRTVEGCAGIPGVDSWQTEQYRFIQVSGVGQLPSGKSEAAVQNSSAV